MRARWRRCALSFALCGCCLPVALRLLLLGPAGPDTSASQPQPAPDEAGLLLLPGAYLAGKTPANQSHCRWEYGLPDRLEYVEDQLVGSPGGTDEERVLAFAIRGRGPEGLAQLSLCSHASAEQVYGVVELARRWEGPIALAVFAPGIDAHLAVAALDAACRCEPAMDKVSVHLVFPRTRPGRLVGEGLERRAGANDCSAEGLQRWSSGPAGTERRRAGLAYPINVARNVARSLAPTQRLLVSDIELLPSEGLASRFLAMLKGRPPRRPSRPRVAFVLPVFEVAADQPPPANKAHLLRQINAGNANYFHRFSCPHCQRFPGLTRWILRPDPGKVSPLIITKREYPQHRWEPIFIGTKYDPLYTEDMSWEGRQDKMTQMFEMCLMNYRLVVVDGAFLVHRPGIKRKDDASQVSERQRAYERQNARIYQLVTRRLIKQYPQNRRCRP